MNIFWHFICRDNNGIGGSTSFDRDVEKAPLDDDDSLDYGDDDNGSKFNEDGSFIGQYAMGERGAGENASSIVWKPVINVWNENVINVWKYTRDSWSSMWECQDSRQWFDIHYDNV